MRRLALLSLCWWLGCSAQPPPAPLRPCPSGDLTTTPGLAPAALPTAPATPPAPSDAEGEAEHDDDVDDDLDEVAPDEALALGPRRHFLDDWDAARLARALASEPETLGTMSFGQPNAGALRGAKQLPEDPRWKRTDPANAWGTEETITALTLAIGAVFEQYPDTTPVWIGHISARHGGPLRPHKSHQAGRDVDVGYWQTDSRAWYARVTPEALDLPRTWLFLRTLIVHSDLEMVLMDRSLQGPLEAYALAQGEDTAWVRGLFHGEPGQLRPLFHHVAGHATHVHLRFFSPTSRETARRVRPLLAQQGQAPETPAWTWHVAHHGDTLGSLSRRYRVSVPALRSANGLRSDRITAGRRYRVPLRGKAAAPAPPPNTPITVPARRLPPPRAAR